MRYYDWIRVAERFGYDPFVIMRQWSERQLGIVLAWMGLDMNTPSRSDYYLMQIASVMSAKSVELKDLLIKFKSSNTGRSEEMTIEQATMIAKATILARLGGAAEHRILHPDGTITIAPNPPESK